MSHAELTHTKQSPEDQDAQELLKQSGSIPRHIAVIMDGNGRWAQQRGDLRLFGHRAGVHSVRDITESCAQLGVKHLTLYTFSTENWGRPSDEVNGLMKLLVKTLGKEAESLHQNNIRLVTIGQTERFPTEIQDRLNEVKELTKDNTLMDLCLALSYSGRWDITQAVQQIAEKVSQGLLVPEEIDDHCISNHLATYNIPDPELVIRTSGEFRVSNFLLWQLAYSEFYVTDTFWPDFRRDELYNAIRSFQKRDRRFGKLSNGYTKSMSASVIRKLIS